MTENKKTTESDDASEDWAILPFDGAEDDERWAKLSSEMDELEKEVDAHEAVHGKILMEEDFSRFPANEDIQPLSDANEPAEDDPF